MKRTSWVWLGSMLLVTGCETGGTAPAPDQTASAIRPAPPTSGPTAASSPAASTASAKPTESGTAPAVGAPAKDPSQASNAFGFAFHQKLPTEGNLAYSSASISVALAMTFAGAKGETATQMAAAMRFPADAEALHAGWASVLESWKNVDDTEIAVANRLYGAKQTTFAPSFMELTTSRYQAPLVPVDFAADAEAQRKLINDWVFQQTRERIKDLIPGGGISRDTRLALVNAMYFKATWASPFEKAQTADGPFASPTGAVTVPMMAQTGSMKFAEIDGVTIAERAYQNNRFAATFVLPAKGQTIGQLEKKLDGGVFDGWVSALAPKNVSMTLPRFKVDPASTMELSGMLSALGMKDVLSDQADFSGMTADPQDRPYFDKVYHKTFVAMDEAGTEAAAATAVVMGPGGAPPTETKVFHADRPFLFFVRDTKTGLIMFSGRVVDPSKAQ